MPKAVRAKSKISVWTQSRGYQVLKREQNARKYGVFRGLEKTTKHCTFGLIRGYLREKAPRNNIKTLKQTFWKQLVGDPGGPSEVSLNGCFGHIFAYLFTIFHFRAINIMLKQSRET